MSIASVIANGGTLTGAHPARKAALKPAVLPRQAPAARDQAVTAARDQAVTIVSAERPEGRYWQAVARYLEDFRESYDPRDGEQAYRSPAQAAEAAARFGADAEAAAEKALLAQRDIRAASSRLDAARTALEETPAWQWRVRARLRAEVALETQRRTASLRDLDQHSAMMDLSLRGSRRAERIAAVLRRSDRAHLAAAGAAARGMGWRPGIPVPSRSAVYVAGRDGTEVLPAIAQR